MSKTLSINPEAFSNCMEYEKPEQPPPTTPTRRPAGTGFCCPIISFTLAIAFGVSEIGAVFFSSCGFTSGVTVVAILSPSKYQQNHYSKGRMNERWKKPHFQQTTPNN